MTDEMLERCKSTHPTLRGLEIELDDNRNVKRLNRDAPLQCWHKGGHEGDHNNHHHAWENEMATRTKLRKQYEEKIAAAKAALTWIGEHCDTENPTLALAEIQHFCVVALTTLTEPESK